MLDLLELRGKQKTFARKKSKGTELLFSGREAKLNRAIFQTLDNGASETIWGILKQITKIRGFTRKEYAVITFE